MSDLYARVGRCRLRYVEAGEGNEPPFVLVHGLGSGAVRWRDSMPLLAQHRRTIAVDLPGFGGSDAPPGSYTPAWLAGALRAFLDAVGVGEAVLVGNSMGGLVATYAAAAWPERVRALVCVSPALPNDGPQPDRRIVLGSLVPSIPLLGDIAYARYMARPVESLVRESLERNLVDPSRVPAETVRALEDDLRSRQERPDALKANIATNRALVWALTARRETTWKVARSVRVPTLFLWGDSDRLVPLHVAYKAVNEVPGAQLVVLDDCGHNPHLERPGEFAGAVAAFARAVEAQEPA